jgi:ABC-2 type transport system ATP-binding protein
VNDATATNPAFVADATIRLDKVSKWFGQKVAVSDVSCSFGPGVAGLLGPNGAGKTTLLRMLTGLIVPSEGTVTVKGRSLRAEPAAYRDVGLVPEEDAVYGELTARQFARYAAILSGIPDPDAAAAASIATVELEDAADRAISGFSKGMRQRAKVAAALVHDPEILILDEPLNGTDPIQRAHLIGLFRRLGHEGRTVVVSSHVLQEVERMADRVIAMVDGKLAAAGDVGAIRRAMTDIPYRVRIDSSDPRLLSAALLEEAVIDGAHVEDGTVQVETKDLASLGRRVPSLSAELNLHLTGFQPQDESLESVFRYLIGARR